MCVHHPILLCVFVRSSLRSVRLTSNPRCKQNAEEKKAVAFRYAYASSLCDKYLATKNGRGATYGPSAKSYLAQTPFRPVQGHANATAEGAAEGGRKTHQKIHTCKKRRTSHGILQARRRATVHATPVVQSPSSCVLRPAFWTSTCDVCTSRTCTRRRSAMGHLWGPTSGWDGGPCAGIAHGGWREWVQAGYLSR